MLKRIVLSVCAGFAAAVVAQDETLYWKGTSASAKVATNWCTDEGLTTAASAAPQTGDNIVFVAASGNMTWDLNDVELASWTQQAGYAGTVTFKTGKQNGVATATASICGWTDDDGETRILKITGDCVLLGGTWTHTAQPSIGSTTAAWKTGEGVYRLIAAVGGDMTLGDGAKIDVTARGFAAGQGPGAPGVQAGASHGGCGGYWMESSVVPGYGSFRSPITIGSGADRSAGAGGGSVQLTVGGNLSLAATSQILANGKEQVGVYPPSGGSVFIVAGSISGGGVISANGSANLDQYNAGYGGGGGGGRIAFVLTGDGMDFPTGFKQIPTALGGKYFPNNVNNAFGGTIYYETKGDVPGEGELWVDKGTSSHSNYGADILAEDGASIHLRKVVLRDGGSLNVRTGVETLSVDEIENVSTAEATVGKVRSFGATLVLRGKSQEVEAVNLWLRKSATLQVGDDGSGTLKLGDKAVLTVDEQSVLDGSLNMKPGSTATYAVGSSAAISSFRLKVTGDVTVDAGAEITALGKGYGPKSGPGGSSDGKFAGMHGGRVWNASSTRHCYGSITRPTMYGSGGASSESPPSYGGGAIAMEVVGDFVNNGVVTANGSECKYYSGAGGSVWIRAKTLAGSGVISANGGIHQNSGGTTNEQGSGGRIAVWLTGANADFSGFADLSATFQAFGGVKANVIYGGAGTVYLQTGAQKEHEGTLIVDNNGRTTYDTEISAGGIGEMDVTDTEVGDVIVRNGGKLTVDTATLTVHGDLRTSSAFTERNGALAFVDASRESHLVGAVTCSHFLCETPDKKLIFGTDGSDVLSVPDGGSFKVVGAAEHPVVLRGEVQDAYWRLNVSAAAEVNVEYVDPAKSDASGGQTVSAKNSDVGKDQDNQNWKFSTVVPGMEITWTGAASDLWSDIGNWDLERAPVETDRIVIPALDGDGVRYPRLNGFAVRALSLTVAAGATLRLDGGELTVDEATSVSGSLVASGSERVELRGDVTFAAGAFTPAKSKVWLVGDAAQLADFAGTRFFDLSIEKAGGSVAFADPFSVGGLMTMRAGGAWTAQFGSVGECACERLVIDGAVGGVAALTLTGASEWKLNVRTYADVRGVKVKKSRATGLKIYPQGPATDLGDNVNWFFDATVRTWTGGDGDFLSEDHWLGGVPGENDLAVIDSAATVTVNDSATVKVLSVSGANAKLLVRAPFAVKESMTVAEGGEISIDSPVRVDESVTVLAGGKLTHSANGSTEQYKLDLTVGGGMFIDAEGMVDVEGRGYAVGCGYGSNGTGNQCGGSHGGLGLRMDKGTQTKCYGSVFRPSLLGSGGGFRQDGNERGGGAAKISVGGVLTVNGEIGADGAAALYYSGSGGSVWITCGTLAGAGTIHADGGTATDCYPGGGGRIAIYQTTASDWSAWDGDVHVHGGKRNRNVGCSAGTVYWQHAGEANGGGMIVIENGNDGFGAGTPVLPDVEPRDRSRDFRLARFVLAEGGFLTVTTNLTVEDVFVGTASSLSVPSSTLTIRSKAHKDGAGWTGAVSTGATGKIVWKKPGMAMLVR